jgi:hypothetical protein
VLIAVVSIPPAPDARAAAARATGMVLADVNRRLAGILPRVLLPAAPAGGASEIAASLEALDFAVVTLDPALVPGDDQRVVARKLALERGALVATDGPGTEHRCPTSSIAVIQRGVRVLRTSEQVTTTERKFSVGRAVLSGGLMLSKKEVKKEVKTTEAQEPFLVVQRSDGEPDLIIYERRLDYRFLGADMQPSSRGNLELVWARLAALAPGRADDRVVRPGFVSGLPLVSGDPVDLALYLVALARARENR